MTWINETRRTDSWVLQYVRDRLKRLVEHGNARKVYEGYTNWWRIHAKRTIMTDTRERELVEAIKTADTPEERRKAVRELAKHNIERSRPIYDRLARK